MNTVLITSALFSIVMAAIAILVVWGCLRFLDYLSGYNFKEYLNEREYEASLGHSIYFAGRFIGACILVGLLFS